MSKVDNSNIQLTPQEISTYSKLFQIADTSKEGIIPPNVAVEILSKSKLPQETLGKIWLLADSQ